MGRSALPASSATGATGLRPPSSMRRTEGVPGPAWSETECGERLSRISLRSIRATRGPVRRLLGGPHSRAMTTPSSASIDGALHRRAVEREGGDFDVEVLPGGAHHGVAADHEAGRGRERDPAGVLERLPRPAHLLEAAESVGDPPVAADQLHGLAAAVDDFDGIGPKVIVVGRGRALAEELRRHRDLDAARGRSIHCLWTESRSPQTRARTVA